MTILLFLFSLFYISDENCYNEDTLDGVIWPCDMSTLYPDSLEITGEPIIIHDPTALIGVTYEDIYGPCSDRALLRRWSIIDWNQYAANGTGLWYYHQLILVQ